MQNLEDLHSENDKIKAPFLLAACFNGHLKFIRRHVQNGILYWEFSPKDKALELVEQLLTKRDPQIPAADLFEAISVWWKQVSEMRNGEIKNGPR